MTRPIYWTCGCGAREVWRGLGLPRCSKCDKTAPQLVEPPQGQGGFDFGAAPADGVKGTGYED